MSSAKQVIVIGAGIIGASIAWHLTKAGAQVTVIAESGRRRRRHAEFLCLDQCQLGQSRSLFPAAHPRHGRVEAAGEATCPACRSPGAAGCAGTCRQTSSKPTPPSTPHGATASNASTASGRRASSPISSSRLISPFMSPRKAWPNRLRPRKALLADAERRGAKITTGAVTALVHDQWQGHRRGDFRPSGLPPTRW